jgi:AP2 domain
MPLYKATHHHILRVDNDATRTRCWKVKIRRHNRTIYKYFTDGRYGGKRKALLAAKAYRDNLLNAISGPEYAIWKRNIKRPDNTSGLAGVGRYIKRERTRDGTWECPVWEAFWHDADGKRHGRRFSVLRFGEDQAKRLARKVRREAVMEVEEEIRRRGKIYGALSHERIR